MIIEHAAVAMGSQHELTMVHTRRESLRAWVGAPPAPGRNAPSPDPWEGADQVRLSPQGVMLNRGIGELPRERAPGVGDAPCACRKSGEGRDSRLALSMESLKAALITRLMEMVTGRKFELVLPPELVDGEAATQVEEEMAHLQAVASRLGSGAEAGPRREGWGVEYHAEESYYEAERTVFAAAGRVETADGRSIAFEVELSMSREYVERNTIDVRAGDAALKDPLVINFGGAAAQLTQTRFAFDLDLDGVGEQLPGLAAGSGYLALDRNGDGRINDGSELFGPRSGSGFGELAELDGDGNGWIDEGDEAFGALRIWTREGDGSERLFALGEKGVGAVYVGHLEAPFRITDGANRTLGQVRGVGLYLKEDGGAGTVQQVDLAV